MRAASVPSYTAKFAYRLRRIVKGRIHSISESLDPPTHNGLPIPPPRMRQLTTLNRLTSDAHIKDGKTVADIVLTCIKHEGVDVSSINSVLDFGCGCGRVMRHLKQPLANASLFGTDVDDELINWSQKNLSSIGDWNVNGYQPPMKYGDNSFDLIYAVSVYTHLDEKTQLQWLEDFYRVMKPGGLLLLSVRELTDSDIADKHWDEINPKGMVIRYRRNEVVDRKWIRSKADLPSYIDVKHSEEYCRKYWSGKFDVKTFHRGISPMGQSFVTLQKPTV